MGCGGDGPGAVSQGSGGWQLEYTAACRHLRRLGHTLTPQWGRVERTSRRLGTVLPFVGRTRPRLETLPSKPLPCIALSFKVFATPRICCTVPKVRPFCHVAPQEARLGFNLRSLPGHSPQLAVEAVRRAAAAARVNATVSITKVGAGAPRVVGLAPRQTPARKLQSVAAAAAQWRREKV